MLTTLLGGLGTVFGPAMGAVVVTAMEKYLAQFGAWVTVTQGVIFMVCVLAFRRGIIGEIQLSEGQPGAVTLARILLAVGVLFGVPALAIAAYGSNGSSALVYATGVVIDVLSIIYLSWRHPAAARVA